MEKTDEVQVCLTRKKVKNVWHNRLVAHVLYCSTWRALYCSLWFKLFYIIQDKNFRGFFIFSVWFKHACTVPNTHGTHIQKHATADLDIHIYPHTGIYTQMDSHTSILAWCLEGWDTVCQKQAWERMSSFLNFFQCFCVCGQESVWACMLEHVNVFMNACIHVLIGVCAHRAGASLWVYSDHAPKFTGATEGWVLI